MWNTVTSSHSALFPLVMRCCKTIVKCYFYDYILCFSGCVKGWSRSVHWWSPKMWCGRQTCTALHSLPGFGREDRSALTSHPATLQRYKNAFPKSSLLVEFVFYSNLLTAILFQHRTFWASKSGFWYLCRCLMIISFECLQLCSIVV